MSKISGKSTLKRKNYLADLVVSHLIQLGHQAKIIQNRENSKKHTDLTLVESSIGLVHIIALSSKKPNEKIPYQKNDQEWLADKAYVAIGWNDNDNRTLLFFVKAEEILGNFELYKKDIKRLRDRDLSKVFV